MINGMSVLGTCLKDRRTKLDPAAFGLSAARRRTSGLRRDEVAEGVTPRLQRVPDAPSSPR
jgi:hypothetical protein